jgi:hypothetical protein
VNTVYVARDLIDAELVRQLLAQHGIESVIRSSFTWLATTPFPTVAVVNAEDAERAAKLISMRD